jgi:uncharacterized protein YebE (UPF0316 family)
MKKEFSVGQSIIAGLQDAIAYAQEQNVLVIAAPTYENDLRERLRDPRYAADYLTAALADGEAVFLAALRNVIEAHSVSRDEDLADAIRARAEARRKGTISLEEFKADLGIPALEDGGGGQ